MDFPKLNQTNLKKMRLIGEISNTQDAARFAAYLLTTGIATKLEQEAGGSHEIWVKEEDQFDQAVRELNAFQADPKSEKYVQAVQQAHQLTRAKDKKRRQLQKKIVQVGAGGVQPRATLTWILIGICTLVALLTNFGDDWQTSKLFRLLEFVAVEQPASFRLMNKHDYPDSLEIRLASIKRGEIWRLVTPMFIHLGTFHLLFNMLWLFQLGRMIENRYGWWSLLWLVLLSAAISNFMQCTVPVWMDGTPPIPTPDGALMTLFGGMSGVVYGLLGFVWMRAVYDRSSNFHLAHQTLYILLGWMFFCMIPGAPEWLFGSGNGVANWAHGIGLIVGIAVGYWPVLMQKS